MAKGQQKSNREAKKPKADKKPTSGSGAPEHKAPAKSAPAKSSDK